MGEDGRQRPTDAKLFTAKEVAAALGKSEKTIWRSCRNGVLDARKDGAGASTPWRIWCDGDPGNPLPGPGARWTSPTERADLELEYRDLSAKLRLPHSSHAGGEPPEWKFRHEYLRRRLRRLKDRRFLPIAPVPWPNKFPVPGGRGYWLHRSRYAWIAELRELLVAEGEDIPEPEPFGI